MRCQRRNRCPRAAILRSAFAGAGELRDHLIDILAKR
jgi:hypothetical protein